MTRDLPALMRFLAVGGGFAVGYSVVTAYLVSHWNLPVWRTSMVVYLICIPLAFTAHRLFSFRHAEARKGGFLIYAALQVASFATVSTLTTRAITGDFLFDTVVYLVTVGTAAILTFIATKLFVFRA